jgi:CheY-like chemotaxis protein
MKRLLFVDNERPLLDGLRSRLTLMRSRWSMEFAESGEIAIERLEQQAFDVIVTDMRMPSMDGAQLLETVSRRAPQMIRIVLSGYADLEQTIRLVPFAHHVALQSIVKDETVTLGEVAKLVAADSALAARVLQIVNSAFFRLAKRMTSIEQAWSYLGFKAIRNLATAVEVFSRWPGNTETVIDVTKLQSHVHSIAAARRRLPRRLRERTTRCWPGYCTTSGIGYSPRNVLASSKKRSSWLLADVSPCTRPNA